MTWSMEQHLDVTCNVQHATHRGFECVRVDGSRSKVYSQWYSKRYSRGYPMGYSQGRTHATHRGFEYVRADGTSEGAMSTKLGYHRGTASCG